MTNLIEQIRNRYNVDGEDGQYLEVNGTVLSFEGDAVDPTTWDSAVYDNHQIMCRADEFFTKKEVYKVWAVVKTDKNGDRFEEICDNKNEAVSSAESEKEEGYFKIVAAVYADYNRKYEELSHEYDEYIEIK